MNDADRERLIEAYRVVLELEPCDDLQIAGMSRMCELIGERTAQRIREMEVAQGLR